ncbi:MAG: hypothetical protein DI637_09320 [Citromicrobium sp.]|nr:MAG: hypothetical protein DI637_09320 [Citromicrobium sp.]
MLVFQAILLGLLWLFRRTFSEDSLATASIFSVGSIFLLFGYAMIGSMMLGDQFSTPIEDWTTAFYFSIVTMSTVGYGDISPTTANAQLFVVSLIILGLTVFATSLSTVVVPLINRRLHSLIHGKASRMKPTDHFVIVSDSVLAENCRQDLIAKGEKVVQILPEESDDDDDSGAFVFGNANDLDVLREANVADAKAVLALGPDDAANAFIVLAVREVDDHVKTVIAVNETQSAARKAGSAGHRHRADHTRQRGPDHGADRAGGRFAFDHRQAAARRRLTPTKKGRPVVTGHPFLRPPGSHRWLGTCQRPGRDRLLAEPGRYPAPPSWSAGVTRRSGSPHGPPLRRCRNRRQHRQRPRHFHQRARSWRLCRLCDPRNNQLRPRGRSWCPAAAWAIPSRGPWRHLHWRVRYPHDCGSTGRTGCRSARPGWR